MVEGAVNGRSCASLVPTDRPVLASTEIDGIEYVAAYQSAGETVMKHVFADRSHAFSEEIVSPTCAVSRDAEVTFAEVVGEVRSVEMLGTRSVETDSGVRRQLEHLGYR